MPSRPSLGGKEDNSRRASLRRLSSLASLNPFNRRRQPSEDVEHPHQSQMPPVPPVPRLPHGETFSMSAFFEPPVEMYGNKRQSYLSLQDDPIHLPKSRTFSNLPVPATAKTRPRPTVPSLSKSQSTAYLPSSRIPTPVGGLRQTSRLTTTSKNVAKPNKPKSMVRSDTMPLLSPSVPKPQRSTVFKENLSLSPIKPLSRLELFHPDTEELIPKGLQPSRNLADAQHDTSSRSPVRPRYPSERQRVLPSMSMSTSAPSKGLSYGSEIKQQRLLSARYPPTPPLPKTPLAASMPSTSHAYQRLKSSNKLSHKHKENTLSPCNERSTPATVPPAPDTVRLSPPGFVPYIDIVRFLPLSPLPTGVAASQPSTTASVVTDFAMIPTTVTAIWKARKSLPRGRRKSWCTCTHSVSRRRQEGALW